MIRIQLRSKPAISDVVLGIAGMIIAAYVGTMLLLGMAWLVATSLEALRGAF